MIAKGTRAPDPKIFSEPGKEVSLSSLRGDGPAVVLFFPLAFSGVCTKEMCAIADDFSKWNDLGAKVIAMSVDSPHVNRKFAESTKAEFPIVSDFNREAMRAFDVERADVGGLKHVSERAAFVIDRDGVVQYAWVGENPGVFPPLDEIQAAVKAL